MGGLSSVFEGLRNALSIIAACPVHSAAGGRARAGAPGTSVRVPGGDDVALYTDSQTDSRGGSMVSHRRCCKVRMAHATYRQDEAW